MMLIVSYTVPPFAHAAVTYTFPTPSAASVVYHTSAANIIYSTPTPPTSSFSSSNGGECEYIITSDMYGIGVRIGFYLQGVSNIFGLRPFHKDPDGRSITASLCFGLLVAFWLGIETTSISLEGPVFVALITAVSLPIIIHPVLFDHPRSSRSSGSLLAVSALYSAAIMSVLFGSINGWYRGSPECSVASAFSGENALSTHGKSAWLILFTVEALLSMALLLTILYRTINAKTKKPPLDNNWRNGIIFGIFSILIVTFCIASVETTIVLNDIHTPGLSGAEYGQWIAFSVGLGAILASIWGLFIPNGAKEKELSSSVNMVEIQKDDEIVNTTNPIHVPRRAKSL